MHSSTTYEQRSQPARMGNAPKSPSPTNHNVCTFPTIRSLEGRLDEGGVVGITYVCWLCFFCPCPWTLTGHAGFGLDDVMAM